MNLNSSCDFGDSPVVEAPLSAAHGEQQVAIFQVESSFDDRTGEVVATYLRARVGVRAEDTSGLRDDMRNAVFEIGLTILPTPSHFQQGIHWRRPCRTHRDGFQFWRAVAETKELKEGVAYADYDSSGLLLGIELLGPCDATMIAVLTELAEKRIARDE